ncbi:uncharacterized protein LOC118437295 [Folsomia candida]|uniref:uncharacterized protein LOC118437295 n=1 Tax=Folsomia candida TaxID=158441 RepID=UPI001604FDB4|nr:uncharacterized protein LOC118437295 [Folsomia candida]
MVAPEQIKGIVTISNNAKMKYIIKIADFETLVSKERIANLKAGSGRISWDRYPRFAEIETWLNNLNSPYVTVSLIGHSYNGLDLHAVKFSTGGAPKKNCAHRCQHQREGMGDGCDGNLDNQRTYHQHHHVPRRPSANRYPHNPNG